jgi:hypothetical protein
LRDRARARPDVQAVAVVTGLADADSVRVTELVPGVYHVFAHDVRGPWGIHIVEIDADACRPVLEARKPAGSLEGRATTTELAAGSIVTINADFFMLPGGTPVSAHVRDGVPFIGPTDRQIFAVTEAGEWRGGVARMAGHAVSRGDSARIAQVNRPATPFSAYAGTHDGLTLFTARADSVPADSAARMLLLRLLDGDERAGRGVVVRADSPVVAAALQSANAALLAHGDARAWARRRAVGDTVTWRARVVMPALGTAQSPSSPRQWAGSLSCCMTAGTCWARRPCAPSFGLQRHPRTAIGWSADGRRLFLVVVDGRQPPYSDGMSLPELTWLFQRIGAADVVNLDGGGSTAIVIGGELVNRPSDREGERPVGNALALTRCGL